MGSGIDLTSAVSARGLSTPAADGGPGLCDLDLEVAPGTLTVVSGTPHDGTTEVALVLSGGLQPTTAEEFRVFGVDLLVVPTARRIAWLQRHVVRVDGSAPLLGYLTIEENLALASPSGSSTALVATLTGADVLTWMPQRLTSQQTWLVSLALGLSSPSDIIVACVPADLPDAAWMTAVREHVDILGGTVIVTGRPGDYAAADDVVTLRGGRVVGQLPRRSPEAARSVPDPRE